MAAATSSSGRADESGGRPAGGRPGCSRRPAGPGRTRRRRPPRCRPRQSRRLRVARRPAGGAAPSRSPAGCRTRASARSPRTPARRPRRRPRSGSATPAKTPNTSAFSRSGASTSARTSSSVAACSTGCSADRSRMMRVIGGDQRIRIGARVDEQAAAAELLAHAGGRRSSPAPARRSRRRCRRRRRRCAGGRCSSWMNCMTGSVQRMWRLTASLFGNSCCARLWLMITTRSLSRRSPSLKSRPASSGTPSAAKKPGETVRNCARGSSSALARTWPSTESWKPGPKLPASRHGTCVPTATRSTPGSSRRCAASLPGRSR